MSKSRLFVMLFVAAALIVSANVWTEARDAAIGNPTPFGFGQRIAGTYLSQSFFFGGAGTLTFHADGTLAAISGTCCGITGSIQSEGYGNWVRTGPREIELTAVVIARSEGAEPGFTDAICTPSERLEFDEDFENYVADGKDDDEEEW